MIQDLLNSSGNSEWFTPSDPGFEDVSCIRLVFFEFDCAYFAEWLSEHFEVSTDASDCSWVNLSTLVNGEGAKDVEAGEFFGMGVVDREDYEVHWHLVKVELIQSIENRPLQTGRLRGSVSLTLAASSSQIDLSARSSSTCVPGGSHPILKLRRWFEVSPKESYL